MVDEPTLRVALSHTLDATDFPSLGAKYEGKVRDNYSTGDGRRYVIATDRISAFDCVLGTIPFKGQVLNRLAAWWFDQTKKVVPNHVLSVPDPNVVECIECEPIMVEMVVRAYATGTTSTSLWTHYARGERVFCGHRLPDGLKKHEKLPAPILTPATKAPKGEHDVSGSREEILATGHVTARDFDVAAALAMKLFTAGQEMCAARGLILVDTKYEFGRTKSGEIIVIDEIHTPDSSRFWRAATYDARMAEAKDPDPLDKDYVRRSYTVLGYAGDGPPPPMSDDIRVGAAQRYIEAYEAVTGDSFVPNTEPPVERMKKSLKIGGGSR
jgi:phosphoribosylaminoimidazole-succinocarboxamide synthase